jgi:hypothetical protein
VGVAHEVTWDVAGTDVPPVNCQKVNILLSVDGGMTYPHIMTILADNDGSEIIYLPDDQPINTDKARIKVEAADNIFFDISDKNFTIVGGSVDAKTQGGNKRPGEIQLYFYPNHQYQIRFKLAKPEDIRHTLSDVQGNIIHSEFLDLISEKTIEHDLKNLPAGLYLVTISYMDGRIMYSKRIAWSGN